LDRPRNTECAAGSVIRHHSGRLWRDQPYGAAGEATRWLAAALAARTWLYLIIWPASAHFKLSL
jgi:hypothetical protein